MRRPVCNTCRPALLKVLHSLYGSTHFDYNEMVSGFYFHLMTGDKLAEIKEPNALMGWIVSTAYYYFLHTKIKSDKLLENSSFDSLTNVCNEIIEDDSAQETRDLVADVLASMPNRTYARILDEVTLEVGQYQGREKSEKLREAAERLGIPVDNLYAKISLAKKQFKETAKKMNLYD